MSNSKIEFKGWNDIMYVPEKYFKDDLIYQAIKAINILDFIYPSRKLQRLSFLFTDVKEMKNLRKVVCHVYSLAKLNQLRNSCAASVLELYEFLKSKNKKDISNLLIKLDDLYDVCTEGTCESIQQFLSEEKSGFQFVFNSQTTKAANINTAAVAIVKNMCATSRSLSEFKSKFEGIVTILRDKLMGKNVINGKIDYMDIESYVLMYGAFLPSTFCETINNQSSYKVLTSQGIQTLRLD
tara:strand:- start:4398 stop:5114 length:717 start_codon:yes stop_codon:yes gene_type:complete